MTEAQSSSTAAAIHQFNLGLNHIYHFGRHSFASSKSNSIVIYPKYTESTEVRLKYLK
jgi:hypothetical protein